MSYGRRTLKERPGVVLRFGWAGLLEKLQTDQARSKFLLWSLERGKDAGFEPDLTQVDNCKDQIRLETLWTLAAETIDKDGEGWQAGCEQRSYAGYVSATKKKGEIPMSREDYDKWRDALAERDPEIEAGLPY